MTDTRADIALVWLTGSPGGSEIADKTGGPPLGVIGLSAAR
jgi:hypothetical protein